MVHGLETIKKLNHEVASSHSFDATTEQPVIMRPPSKILQIQTVVIPAGANNGDFVELIALCEDGSLWVQYRSNGYANVPSDGQWYELVAAGPKISEPLNESMERLEEFWDKNGIDPLAPEESSRGPLSQLKAALKSDDDYAWTWLCNLACIGLDSGGTHENSNRRAAQFMKNAFDIDVTQCENWKQFELQWSEPPEVDQTLDEWMQAYEAAVESGQSRISREEAEKRYDAQYGRNRQQNDDY